ncbi:hypothetical protein VaNZ11_007618, partial [Volvox africanus]
MAQPVQWTWPLLPWPASAKLADTLPVTEEERPPPPALPEGLAPLVAGLERVISDVEEGLRYGGGGGGSRWKVRSSYTPGVGTEAAEEGLCKEMDWGGEAPLSASSPSSSIQSRPGDPDPWEGTAAMPEVSLVCDTELNGHSFRVRTEDAVSGTEGDSTTGPDGRLPLADDGDAHLPIPARVVYGIMHLAAELRWSSAPPAGVVPPPPMAAAAATVPSLTEVTDSASALLDSSSRVLALLLPSNMSYAYAMARLYGRLGQVPAHPDVLAAMARGAELAAEDTLAVLGSLEQWQPPLPASATTVSVGSWPLLTEPCEATQLQGPLSSPSDAAAEEHKASGRGLGSEVVASTASAAEATAVDAAAGSAAADNIPIEKLIPGVMSSNEASGDRPLIGTGEEAALTAPPPPPDRPPVLPPSAAPLLSGLPLPLSVPAAVSVAAVARPSPSLPPSFSEQHHRMVEQGWQLAEGVRQLELKYSTTVAELSAARAQQVRALAEHDQLLRQLAEAQQRRAGLEEQERWASRQLAEAAPPQPYDLRDAVASALHAEDALGQQIYEHSVRMAEARDTLSRLRRTAGQTHRQLVSYSNRLLRAATSRLDHGGIPELRLQDRQQQLAAVAEVLAEHWYAPSDCCMLVPRLQQLVRHPMLTATAAEAGDLENGGMPRGLSGDLLDLRLACATAWLSSIPLATKRMSDGGGAAAAAAAAISTEVKPSVDCSISGGNNSDDALQEATALAEASSANDLRRQVLELVELTEAAVQRRLAAGKQAQVAAEETAENAAVAREPARVEFEGGADGLKVGPQVVRDMMGGGRKHGVDSGCRSSSGGGGGVLSLRSAYALTAACWNMGVMPPVLRNAVASDIRADVAAASPRSCDDGGRVGGGGGSRSNIPYGTRVSHNGALDAVVQKLFLSRVLGATAAPSRTAASTDGGNGDGVAALAQVPYEGRMLMAMQLLDMDVISPLDAVEMIRDTLAEVLPRLRDPSRLTQLVKLMVGPNTAATAASSSTAPLAELAHGPASASAIPPPPFPLPPLPPPPPCEGPGAMKISPSSGTDGARVAVGLAGRRSETAIPAKVAPSVMVMAAPAASAVDAVDSAAARARCRIAVLVSALPALASNPGLPLEVLRVICAGVYATQTALTEPALAALTSRLRSELPEGDREGETEEPDTTGAAPGAPNDPRVAATTATLADLAAASHQTEQDIRLDQVALVWLDQARQGQLLLQARLREQLLASWAGDATTALRNHVSAAAADRGGGGPDDGRRATEVILPDGAAEAGSGLLRWTRDEVDRSSMGWASGVTDAAQAAEVLVRLLARVTKRAPEPLSGHRLDLLQKAVEVALGAGLTRSDHERVVRQLLRLVPPPPPPSPSLPHAPSPSPTSPPVQPPMTMMRTSTSAVDVTSPPSPQLQMPSTAASLSMLPPLAAGRLLATVLSMPAAPAVQSLWAPVVEALLSSLDSNARCAARDLVSEHLQARRTNEPKAPYDNHAYVAPWSVGPMGHGTAATHGHVPGSSNPMSPLSPPSVLASLLRAPFVQAIGTSVQLLGSGSEAGHIGASIDGEDGLTQMASPFGLCLLRNSHGAIQRVLGAVMCEAATTGVTEFDILEPPELSKAGTAATEGMAAEEAMDTTCMTAGVQPQLLLLLDSVRAAAKLKRAAADVTAATSAAASATATGADVTEIDLHPQLRSQPNQTPPTPEIPPPPSHPQIPPQGLPAPKIEQQQQQRQYQQQQHVQTQDLVSGLDLGLAAVNRFISRHWDQAPLERLLQYGRDVRVLNSDVPRVVSLLQCAALLPVLREAQEGMEHLHACLQRLGDLAAAAKERQVLARQQLQALKIPRHQGHMQPHQQGAKAMQQQQQGQEQVPSSHHHQHHQQQQQQQHVVQLEEELASAEAAVTAVHERERTLRGSWRLQWRRLLGAMRQAVAQLEALPPLPPPPPPPPAATSPPPPPPPAAATGALCTPHVDLGRLRLLQAPAEVLRLAAAAMTSYEATRLAIHRRAVRKQPQRPVERPQPPSSSSSSSLALQILSPMPSSSSACSSSSPSSPSSSAASLATAPWVGRPMGRSSLIGSPGTMAATAPTAAASATAAATAPATRTATMDVVDAMRVLEEAEPQWRQLGGRARMDFMSSVGDLEGAAASEDLVLSAELLGKERDALWACQRRLLPYLADEISGELQAVALTAGGAISDGGGSDDGIAAACTALARLLSLPAAPPATLQLGHAAASRRGGDSAAAEVPFSALTRFRLALQGCKLAASRGNMHDGMAEITMR